MSRSGRRGSAGRRGTSAVRDSVPRTWHLGDDANEDPVVAALDRAADRKVQHYTALGLMTTAAFWPGSLFHPWFLFAGLHAGSVLPMGLGLQATKR